MLTQHDVRAIFESAGALRRGHFLLSSGRHSPEYWEKFWILQDPAQVVRLCGEIARRFEDRRVQVVLGPTTGGILLAYETARQLGCKALYAEKEAGVRCLRRGLELSPGARALVVDDVMTTGASTRECVELARTWRAEVVGAAVLVDRSGGAVDVGAPLEALLTVQAPSYEPGACPLCDEILPLQEPGTTRTR